MILSQLQTEFSNFSAEHVPWVYAGLTILFLWNAWMSIIIISLKEKAGKWEQVSEQLTLINKKLDLFLKQETDSLKEIAQSLINKLDDSK